MQNQAKTIKIFLAEGKPTGLKVLELLGSTIQGFVIPRDSLKEALQRDDLRSQGVYFLIGESEEGKQIVYVGESENFAERIQNHQRTKDFWQTAICFISKDDNLSKAHVKYLESFLGEEIEEIGKVVLEKGKSSTKAKLSESEIAYVTSFAAEIKVILSALGFTFLKRPLEEESVEERFFFSGSGFEASGYPSSEGFVVERGAVVRKSETESFRGTAGSLMRQTLLDREILREENNESYTLAQDHVFSSSSMASSVVAGRATNGWTSWKTDEGKTLDEVKRQEI